VSVLKSYSVGTVHDDRYGGMWPSERVSHGVRYEACEQTKSDLSVGSHRAGFSLATDAQIVSYFDVFCIQSSSRTIA